MENGGDPMIRAVPLLSFVVLTVGCSSNNHGEDICKNAVPPPAACMTMCDPSPGAANVCPLGYHCEPDGFCDAFCTQGGNECGDGYRCTDDGRCISTACQGLECSEVDCASMGMPATTISGTVFAPNGTLPLYGIDVYVPNADPGMFPDGAICDRCDQDLPGSPVVRATSDEAGKFSIGAIDPKGAPAGDNIPVIISSGKWRRQIVVPHVTACTDNPIAVTDTSLPKDHTQGDIPKIAISTGSADALECLVRKLGIADSEIGVAGSASRIHLYTDGGSAGQGAASVGGTPMADSTTLWNTVDGMKPYDIVIFSCEGAQNANTKSQAAMDAVKAYADLGGRMFMSHWHNIWIEGNSQAGGGTKPAVWPGIATWTDNDNQFQTGTDTIDEANNPKGTAFATWMLNVMGSSVRDQIDITAGRGTAIGVDPTKAERWVYHTVGATQDPQNFQFTTPNEADPANRCGKVVFSDMHVSADSSSPKGGDFPGTPGNGCAASLALTAQEKALAFMLFDLSSCVGTIF
jgi:hypothetical protein